MREFKPFEYVGTDCWGKNVTEIGYKVYENGCHIDTIYYDPDEYNREHPQQRHRVIKYV